jgi:hypothetical protein
MEKLCAQLREYADHTRKRRRGMMRMKVEYRGCLYVRSIDKADDL